MGVKIGKQREIGSNVLLFFLSLFVVAATILITHFFILPQGLFGEESDEKLQGLLWILSIVLGSLSVVVLLIYTTKLKRPLQFSTLPVYQFFALSLLIISMIVAISLLPNTIEDLPIAKISQDNGEISSWYLIIGETINKTNSSVSHHDVNNELESNPSDSTTQSDSSKTTAKSETNDSTATRGKDRNGKEWFVFQIPYFILIPGLLGAYIRYLYKDVREFKEDLKSDLLSLKEIFLEHRNKVYEISLAMDASLNDILKFADKFTHKEKRDPYITTKNLLDVCNCTNNYIYSLPPEAVTPFSKYLKDKFSELSVLETSYEKQRFQVGDKTNTKTLTVVGAFFLAPILAVVAWLIAEVVTPGIHKEMLIVLAFSAGLSADAIVKKMWSLTGEKLKVDHDADKAPFVEIKKLDVNPKTGKAPLSVSFKLAINGKEKKIEWDFGDSSSVTGGKEKQHEYKKPGKYNGKVMVTDQKGDVEEKGFVINVTKSSDDT